MKEKYETLQSKLKTYANKINNLTERTDNVKVWVQRTDDVASVSKDLLDIIEHDFDCELHSIDGKSRFLVLTFAKSTSEEDS